MKKDKNQYYLNETNPERMSEKINEYLSGLDMDPRMRIRIRFAMDEILLRIIDHFGNNQVADV